MNNQRLMKLIRERTGAKTLGEAMEQFLNPKKAHPGSFKSRQ